MATITKPMALDESFNTTESTSRNQADVLVGIEQAIVRGFGQVANAVSYDNTDSGLTADNVQDAIDEVDDTVDGLVDDVAEISSDIESTKTATGNPLTLTDCAPINAESLLVELEPKQDLHGQDAPYVGGAGKNKFDIEGWLTDRGVTYTKSGNSYTFYVTQSLYSDPYVFSDTAILTNFNSAITYPSGSTASGCGFNLYDETDESIVYRAQSYSNETGRKLRFDWSTIGYVTITEPILVMGNDSVSPFAPYSNICPITGYTEVNVDDVGVNQWDEEWELGDYNDSGQAQSVDWCIRSKQDDYIPVLGNTVYYAKSPEDIYPCFYDINKTFISKTQVIANTTFTTPANARYMRFVIHSNYGTTYNHDISINYPSTVTTYEPYHSSNATIQFGQTVYGGSMDFLTGVVTVTDANIASYAGETLPSTWISDRDAYSSGGTPTTGAQVVYKLSTPTTLQLTPQELKLLKGTNNLTTNGTTINLGYQPDNVIGEVKGEIEKCAVDAEFMQFSDGTDTFTDVNLSLDAFLHKVSVVGSKIEQKRFMCFEVMDKMGGVLQGILASCIAFTDGAKTPSGTAFRAYIESLQMYVNFRIYGSGGSYTLAYQSESSFSASAFYVRVRLMNNL